MIRLLSRSAVLAAAMLLSACNVNDQARASLMSLKLDDSLSIYDSIRVDILYPTGKPYLEAVFHGPYVPDADHDLDGIDLGANPPARFQVLITAYRGKERALVYGVKVGPDGAETPKILVRTVPKDTVPVIPVEILPNRVLLNTPSPLSLGAEGQATQALAEVLPKGADQGLLWSSSDTAVARVDGAGMIFPGRLGETDITVRSRRAPNLSATLHIRVISITQVNGVNIAPDQALIFLGGAPLKLEAQAMPAEAKVGLVFTSADTTVARVSAMGLITAVAPGKAAIHVHPEGHPLLSLSCQVTVERDVPLLEIGTDRHARPGDTIGFPLKVSQAYGEVAALKWDLDGNGVWDDSTNQSVAAPRRAYDGKDSLVTAFFYVRDTEGNEATRFVSVHVGNASPLIPPAFAAGTTASPTRETRPTWAWTGAPGGIGRFRYSLDGGPEIETRALSYRADSLADGAHTLSLRELDAFGTSSPTVARSITVITSGPKVVILSPSEGALTRAASISVSWSVQPLGGAVVTQAGSENLAGRQGPVLIVREAFDSLGNRGADTVLIIRDTIPPAAPAFTAECAPAVVNSAYAGPLQWAWSRGGDAGDVFMVSLNGGAAIIQSGQTYALPPSQFQTWILEVREVDPAGNASDPVSYPIQVDLIAPPAPVVSASGASGGPGWAWSAANGSEGARVFRYRLDDVADWSQEVSATAYAPPDLAPGGHVLHVQERDAAGNWSPAGSAPAVFP